MSSDVIRIINADATDEEIAAIVLALASLAPAETTPSRRTSSWAAPGSALRQPLHPGSGQWRSSALPR